MVAVEPKLRSPAPARRRGRAEPERGGGPPRGRARRLRARIDWMPYWLLFPSLVLIAVLLGYPLVRLVETSFQAYGLSQLFSHKTVWNGVTNYRIILTSGAFWDSVLRSVLFTGACVGGTMGVGMGVALLLRRVNKVVRGAVSIAMVLAWALPPISAAIVWQWLFANQYGVVDWLLTALHLGTFQNFDWTGSNPLLAFVVLTMMIVWQAVPFVALSLYAGISQVPQELYEAARVDGASGWEEFRRVTVPLLSPIIGLLVILSTIWDFNVFTQIWVLTQGGPNGGTETIGVYSYVEAFIATQYGLGAAISVASMVLVAIMSFYYVRVLIRSGEVR
ncbi:MAG: sugar ABC transporter permease [Actinomycetota bacterium]|jgi:N,N'-diacetylchitobiose transport system permease protein|nr:sugar ABC transporter permease [Actinomycetota bacterium]